MAASEGCRSNDLLLLLSEYSELPATPAAASTADTAERLQLCLAARQSLRSGAAHRVRVGPGGRHDLALVHHGQQHGKAAPWALALLALLTC